MTASAVYAEAFQSPHREGKEKKKVFTAFGRVLCCISVSLITSFVLAQAMSRELSQVCCLPSLMIEHDDDRVRLCNAWRVCDSPVLPCCLFQSQEDHGDKEAPPPSRENGSPVSAVPSFGTLPACVISMNATECLSFAGRLCDWCFRNPCGMNGLLLEEEHKYKKKTTNHLFHVFWALLCFCWDLSWRVKHFDFHVMTVLLLRG